VDRGLARLVELLRGAGLDGKTLIVLSRRGPSPGRSDPIDRGGRAGMLPTHAAASVRVMSPAPMFVTPSICRSPSIFRP